MGQCYENDQLNMTEGAIRCYRRAAENGDREGEPLEPPEPHYLQRAASVLEASGCCLKIGGSIRLADSSMQLAVGRGPAVRRGMTLGHSTVNKAYGEQYQMLCRHCAAQAGNAA